MTDKFKNDPEVFKPLALPIAPETVLTTMTDECDAAGPYAEAIAEYQAHPSAYGAVNNSNVDQLPAVEKLLAGTHCKAMTLFTKDPQKVVNYDSEKAPIEALRALGKACANKGLLLKAKKDYDGAKKYGEAAFSLGAKMYNERIVWDEFDTGLANMAEGGGLLLRIAKETNDVAGERDWAQFDAARVKFADLHGKLMEMHRVTHSIDPNTNAARAGDVFALADKSQERMWRVEACLQLANIKRNVGDEGKAADQRYAQILMRRISTSDPDPIVKAAANKALNITEEEYNKQR
jgi:hypothetical protein